MDDYFITISRNSNYDGWIEHLHLEAKVFVDRAMHITPNREYA